MHNSESIPKQQFAIRLSLGIGFIMLFIKTYAYIITNSTAILSDAAESVVHVFAVSFAAFSLWMSLRPPDKSHQYGHDKIGYFSAGIEGIMIVLAAVFIIYKAVEKSLMGFEIANLDMGILYLVAASIINLALGGFLIWRGKHFNSLILIANGKHVLTDFWTSLGVILGLLLVLWTDWSPFDPIIAVLVGLNILWSGGKLMRQSFGGLMDERNPDMEKQIISILDKEIRSRGLQYHQLRHRFSGTVLWIDVHLLFPKETNLHDAHWQATEIEAAIKSDLSIPTNITTHLEPIEEHTKTHQHIKKSKE
jgi:cation diffusion facilitator family transporter